MNMVVDAADFQKDAALATDDAADVAIEFVLKIGRDERQAAFGAEDDVIEEICMG